MSTVDIERRRKLQLLKGSNGEYVISIVTDLYALMDFIEAERTTLKAELLAEIEQNLSDDDRGNDFIYKDTLVKILEEL